jgi:hypothetical protein
MDLDASYFLSAIEFLDTVPSRKTESSDFIRLRAGRGKLRLDLASEVSASVDIAVTTNKGDEWETHVPRKALKAFIGKGIEAKLRLVQTTGGLTLQTGRRKATFAPLATPRSGYGIFQQGAKESALTLDGEHVEALKLAAKYTVVDEIAPDLDRLHITEDTLTATNRVSAFRAVFASSFAGAVPSLFASIAEPGGKFFFSSAGCRYVPPDLDGWILHPPPSATATIPMSKLDAIFEDAAKWKVRLRVSLSEFLACLDRLGRLDSPDKTFRIERAKGEKILRLKTSSSSAAFTEEIDYAGPDEQLNEELLIGSIVPFLTNTEGETLTIRFEPGTPYFAQVKGSTNRLIIPRRRA